MFQICWKKWMCQSSPFKHPSVKKPKEVHTYPSTSHLIQTMGSCFSQESRRLHERLDEYDDDFLEDERDHIIEEKSSNWLEQTTSSGAGEPSMNLEKESFTQNRSDSMEYDWSIPLSESEPSPETSSFFEDMSFSLSSPSGLQNSSIGVGVHQVWAQGRARWRSRWCLELVHLSI